MTAESKIYWESLCVDPPKVGDTFRVVSRVHGDRSWAQSIWRCTYADAFCVVGFPLLAMFDFEKHPTHFPVEAWLFAPVAQEMLEALGLQYPHSEVEQ